MLRSSIIFKQYIIQKPSLSNTSFCAPPVFMYDYQIPLYTLKIDHSMTSLDASFSAGKVNSAFYELFKNVQHSILTAPRPDVSMGSAVFSLDLTLSLLHRFPPETSVFSAKI